MGADLYIPALRTPALLSPLQSAFDAACLARDSLPDSASPSEREAAQSAVSSAHSALYSAPSYFRDSYNESSLLSRIGLSWWTDVIPLCEASSCPPSSECNIDVPHLQSFLSLLSSRAPRGTALPFPASPSDDPSYFTSKLERLYSFLDSAILHGGAYFSL
mgnify:CR=1 FL=1